jgi:hypothetical protein
MFGLKNTFGGTADVPKHKWPARAACSRATMRASEHTWTSVGRRQAEKRGQKPLCDSQSWGRVRTSTNRGSWRVKQNSQILRRSSIISFGKRVKEVSG